MASPIYGETEAGKVFLELIENIDWQLLKAQKRELITRIGDDEEMGAPEESVEDRKGILNFIDAIQDAASEVVGAETVFGPSCPKCGGHMNRVEKDYKCPECELTQ